MTGRVERVQGLRSSGAAGAHVHEPTRAELLAAALADYEDDTHEDDDEGAQP